MRSGAPRTWTKRHEGEEPSLLLVFTLCEIARDSLSKNAVHALSAKYPTTGASKLPYSTFGYQRWTMVDENPVLCNQELPQILSWYDEKSLYVQGWLDYWRDRKDVKIVIIIESHSHSTTGDIQYSARNDLHRHGVSGSWLDVSDME